MADARSELRVLNSPASSRRQDIRRQNSRHESFQRQSFPAWLRRPLPHTARGRKTEAVLEDLRLNTICEEARCPNRGECYERGTATFLVLGDICTRGCTFCSVHRGKPLPLENDEPARVAEAVERLGLRHVVITSVTRDDLPDGGARQFARVIEEIRRRSNALVEILTPDFGGDTNALDRVLEARPDIFNHNLETVPRLYCSVRAGSDYRRSLEVLRVATERLGDVGITKSGIMLGLGETRAEVRQVMRDLREVDCDLLTLGQYLRPTPRHHEVVEFVHPDLFDSYAEEARAMGYLDVFSGPYVRSSYLADRTLERLEAGED